MVRKLIQKISVVLLTVMLFWSASEVKATSRTANLNLNNQDPVFSDFMMVCANNIAYPVDYMTIAGDTSRGKIKFYIYEYESWYTSYTILDWGICDVGQKIATTGYSGGTKTPLIVDSNHIYARLYIEPGDVVNKNYSYYIGSSIMSTPLEDLLYNGNISKANIGPDMDSYYQNINEKAERVIQDVKEWDALNEKN